MLCLATPLSSYSLPVFSIQDSPYGCSPGLKLLLAIPQSDLASQGEDTESALCQPSDQGVTTRGKEAV